MWNVILFGVILFEVQVVIFVQLVILQAPLSVFHNIYSSFDERISMYLYPLNLNLQISFKILLSMCLLIIEKGLWTNLWSNDFQNGTKITITITEVVLSQVSFPTTGSKKSQNKHMEYHGIFKSLKFLFGSWNLEFNLQVLVKAKFFLMILTRQM